MKIIPILAITNALALGAAAILYLEVDDLKSQVSTKRGASRVESGDSDADTAGYTQAQLDRAVERALARREPEGAARELPKGTDAPDAEGKAIDRELAAPDSFDKDAELNRPGMDYFRQRVRLAQELNSEEDRITREVDRIDQLIANARIGSLTPVQKKKVAEALVESRDKGRLIWRGVWQREDIRNAPEETRREAFRAAISEEQETLRAETQKNLESLMPAADAATLLESNRGGDRGGRMTGRSRRSR